METGRPYYEPDGCQMKKQIEQCGDRGLRETKAKTTNERDEGEDYKSKDDLDPDIWIQEPDLNRDRLVGVNIASHSKH